MTDTPGSPRPRGAWPALRRVARAIGIVEIVIGVIALLMIFVFILMQAGQRYLPFEGFAWTGELSRFALIWLTFSAMGLLVSSRGHIALEIVDSIRKPMLVRSVQVFALVVVAVTAVALVLEASALISTQSIVRSPVLRLPMSWVYVPVLIGAVSTAIRAAVAAIDVAVHGPVTNDYEDEQSAPTEGTA